MSRIAVPLLLVLALFALGAAEPPKSADLSADTETTDLATGDSSWIGKAKFSDGNTLLEADEIRYDRTKDVAVATGHVALTRLEERVLADKITYSRRSGTFTAVRLRAGNFPFYIEGASADGKLDAFVIHDALVYYREPGKWQPTIRAKTIYYSPGHYLRMANSYVGIGQNAVIPMSQIGQDLSHGTSLADVTAQLGYRKALGGTLDAFLHLPVADGLQAGPDVGIYTNRGIMVGPAADYHIDDPEFAADGTFRSGYIYDLGDRSVDVLGVPVPPNRAFAEWENFSTYGDHWSLDGELNWWSDPEIIRDFRPKEFPLVQDPDTYVNFEYTDPNWIGSLFTRFQPNYYYDAQERLPELRYDLLPSPLADGLVQRSDISLDYLREDPPQEGVEMAEDRLDAFYGLSLPFTLGGALDLTPVVGGRYTQYWDTVGAPVGGGTGRALGEIGIDGQLRSYGTFDYRNPLWEIDGLRHLFVPYFNYRYIPGADKAEQYIPPIDRETFSTYLPTLELGDLRNLDELQAENILRLGINNTLQTRDPQYGSRDLVRFDVAEDFRFARVPGEYDRSDFHTELDLMPAHWLELSVADTLDPVRLTQRELNTSITVHDGDLWSFNFGSGFLTDDFATYYQPGVGTFPITGIDTFHFEAKYRINEVWEAFARTDYDARTHLFADQYYGVYQKLENTWTIEYAVNFYSGPNREGHFGLAMAIDLVRF